MSQVIANIAPGLQLLILTGIAPDSYSASLFSGEWPAGKCISCTLFNIGEAYVSTPDHDDADQEVMLWLGQTHYPLPWLELLKVADALHLPIDMPIAAGQQVPA